MKRHNSCLNTRAAIEYVQRRGGPVEELLVGLETELAGIEDPLAFLSDSHNWVSVDVVRKMFVNAKRITGDEQAAYHIGFESVIHRKLGYIQQVMVKAMGTPRQAFRRLKWVNDRFNRTKEIETVMCTEDRAVVRFHWDMSLEMTKDFCLINQGIYSALFIMWGVKPARVTENACQFDGDDYCELELNWDRLSLKQRAKLFFHGRNNVLTAAVNEMEQGKRLLEQKYAEVEELNAQLHKRIAELEMIQQASQSILSGIDFGSMLPTVLDLFIKAINYTRGMIMLVDREAGVLRYAYGVDSDLEYLSRAEGYEIPLTRTQNILVRVALNGEPVIAADPKSLNLNPENFIIRNFRPQSFVILPLRARGTVVGVLAADASAKTAPVPVPDREFLNSFANQAALALENVRMYQELREGSLRSIQALASAVEAKDPYTRGHSERVAALSVELAQAVGIKGDELDVIRDMCLLHDIGKIGIARGILNKNGPLTDEEFRLIHNHPVIGQMIVSPLNMPEEGAAIIRHHHERYDGRGYPDGLVGEETPIPVRISTICDTFDAMVYDRPYRRALPLKVALKELRDGAGAQFDPDLVKTFIRLVDSGVFDDYIIPAPARPPTEPVAEESLKDAAA